MTTTSFFSKTLGSGLADASHICQVTTTSGDMGIHLSVVQSPGLDRSYRIKVPSNATGSGVWRRIVPYDATEKFPDQNHWAVDIMSVNSVTILRLVRTKQGSPPSTTALTCKVMASPSSGDSITLENSSTTSTGATNAGVFEGSMITPMDGMVGINTDSPAHTLDVLGNVNTSGTYKIGGNVLTSNALRQPVINSSLTTLGTLSSLNVAGGVSLTGLSAATTGNVIFVNPSSGAVSYGALDISGNLNVTNLTASGNVSATSLIGTLATAAQPNITSVGTLGTLGVTGNVSVANLHSNQVVNTGTAYRIGNVNVLTSTALGTSVVSSSLTSVGTLSSLNVTDNVTAGSLSGTSITGTLATAAQPSITSVGTWSSLNVTGNVAAGNLSGTTITGTNLVGTLQNAAQPNITSVGTFSSLAVSGGVTASTLTGTLQTAAQPNITSIGTLSSLNVTGNVTAGNVSGTTLSGTHLVGTLQTAAQPNITSIANLSTLTVTGNVIIDSTKLTVNSVANRVGIATANPAFPLDMTGSTNLSSGSAYLINGVSVLSGSTLGSGITTSSLTSVGTLSSLNVTGNVTAGNVSGTRLSGTFLEGTLQTAAQPSITSVGNLSSLNVTGNFSLNGSQWASSVIHRTTTPFLYTGPGTAYSNGVSFYSQTQTTGTAFVTASGTNNSVFTFSTSGTYMLQAEVEVGFPWMPDGDINTYYLVNNNSASRRGNESHAPSNFSCTRPYLLTVAASDNVRFVIESSSGNEYEVGLNSARLTMLKLA